MGEYHMEYYELSFGKVGILRNDIAEIIVDEGIDVNIQMVDEIHHFLLSIFVNSFSLLINKTNSYSTQLDALIKFGTLSTINKIAMYAPNRMAKLSADFEADIPSAATLNIQVFYQRGDALSWLDYQPTYMLSSL
jgi:hypothetical protein